jgi:hypothetical protein
VVALSINVIPVKTGIHPADAAVVEGWTPVFTGVTIVGDSVAPLQHPAAMPE